MQLLRPVNSAAGPGQFQIELMNERRSEQQATSGQVKNLLFKVCVVKGVCTCRTAKMKMTKRQLPLVVGLLTVAQQSQARYHPPLILLIH